MDVGVHGGFAEGVRSHTGGERLTSAQLMHAVSRNLSVAFIQTCVDVWSGTGFPLRSGFGQSKRGTTVLSVKVCCGGPNALLFVRVCVCLSSVYSFPVICASLEKAP